MIVLNIIDLLIIYRIIDILDSQIQMLFRKIIEELEKRKIRYLIIGGVAVNLHGYSRITKDLDLMISFEKENVDKFIELVNDLGYIPKVPVDIKEFADPKKREEWKNEKNMQVFSVRSRDDEFEYIDIMIQDHLDFEKAYKNRKVFIDDKISVSVISINDLIKLKELAGRGRDLLDMKLLKKLREQLDE